ncbi:MAG: VRR-NUC domain-containing protein [Muribaculaceae bacterium]|nr:VRR-NUC domain-containing protein [Muribaculaceae bacterium]
MRRDIRDIVEQGERSEKVLEAYLVKKVTSLGGLALKFSSHTQAGFPDRLVMLPGGETMWVELKSTGKKPTALQLYRFKQLGELGQLVFVCDTKEKIDHLFNDNEV